MGHWTLTPRAAHKPTPRQLEWAAGFMEGEGWFGVDGRVKHTNRGTQYCAASQVQREPLLRLKRMFGGRVVRRRPLGNTVQPFWMWRIGGVRGRGVMMTLYSMMSPRRKRQIRRALEWRR